MAGLMVPGEATIIPLFNLANNLNLVNTYSGLILPSLAGPFAVIILKEFLMAFPMNWLKVHALMVVDCFGCIG